MCRIPGICLQVLLLLRERGCLFPSIAWASLLESVERAHLYAWNTMDNAADYFLLLSLLPAC